MQLVYASRTGNVEKLISRLGISALKIESGEEKASGDYVLVTYTDGAGILPPTVEKFIEENKGGLKAAAVSGNSQAKLVRVIKGEVLDVAVDLRKSSPTFGKYVSVLLSEENKRQFFIPRGFAHGFAVLSEEAIFTYKVDNKYAPQAEASILFNDKTLGIDWPLSETQMLLSSKDREGTAFKDAVYFE